MRFSNEGLTLFPCVTLGRLCGIYFAKVPLCGKNYAKCAHENVRKKHLLKLANYRRKSLFSPCAIFALNFIYCRATLGQLRGKHFAKCHFAANILQNGAKAKFVFRCLAGGPEKAENKNGRRSPFRGGKRRSGKKAVDPPTA